MTALSIQLPYQIFADSDGTPLDNGYVWIGTTNLDPRTNPINVYFDAALTQVAPNPLRTVNGYVYNAGSPAQLYIDGVNFSIRVEDKKSVLVYSFPAGSGISPNASGVVYLPAGTGAVATTAAEKFGEALDAINDFGADNTGATNTTSALMNFYNACILTGKKGRIRAGTYKITTGVLVFNCNQTNKAWPNIETDGYDEVFFVVDSATATNAPVLQWKNGVALSSATYQWLGGSHGGFTCTDSTGATAALRSVISLQGVKGLRLTDRIIGNNMPGDVVTIPQALYAGSNPDPYAVSDLRYDVIEANNCTGYAINNLNFVGQDSWVGNGVRAIGGGGGIWGSGSGCKYGELTVANCAGRGYDDGTFSSSVGGSPQRNYITIAEMDNVQYPFRFNKTSNTIFLGLRIIHRFNVSPNVSGLYWPRIGIDVSGGASANCTNLQLQVFHRIESGGVLANLGIFCTGNGSGNISNFQMDVDYADNGALGVTDALMFTNFPTIATGIIQRRSKNLLYIPDRANIFAIANSGSPPTINNTGMYTSAAIVAFTVEQASGYQLSNYYNTSTSTFTAPRAGLFYVKATIALTVAAGTRIRMAVMQGATAHLVTFSYAATAGLQHYTIQGFIKCVAGDQVYICADQNTAAPVAVAPTINWDEINLCIQEVF